jgi:hypothetical protein
MSVLWSDARPESPAAATPERTAVYVLAISLGISVSIIATLLYVVIWLLSGGRHVAGI